MEVVYHPLVRRDVEKALSYYRKIAARLAEEFHAELRDVIHQATENPLRFHPVDQGFRRAKPETLSMCCMRFAPRIYE